MKTWCGSHVDPAGRRGRILLGWIRFLWQRLWCRHAWLERPQEREHFCAGNLRLVYRCPKCGARRVEFLY